MDDLFSAMMQPFASVQNSHRQLSFYRNHLNLIVCYCKDYLLSCINHSFDILLQEPRRIVLGEYITWKGEGPTRRSIRKQDEMMYVPILDTLQSLLRSEYLANEVSNNGPVGVLSAFTYCRSIKNTKTHGNATLVTMLMAEATKTIPCSPFIGMDYRYFFTMMMQRYAILWDQRKKSINSVSYFMIITYLILLQLINILGTFYFMLGNLHPKHRSKLSSIFLVALVKHKLLQKYGMDRILEPFVQDIKKLVST